MGLDVELFVAEAGPFEPPLAQIGDALSRLAKAVGRGQNAEPERPLLDRIDLYGVTEFSAAEMSELLGELDHLPGTAVTEAVRGLARRCRDEDGLALRFIGD